MKADFKRYVFSCLLKESTELVDVIVRRREFINPGSFVFSSQRFFYSGLSAAFCTDCNQCRKVLVRHLQNMNYDLHFRTRGSGAEFGNIFQIIKTRPHHTFEIIFKRKTWVNVVLVMRERFLLSLSLEMDSFSMCSDKNSKRLNINFMDCPLQFVSHGTRSQKGSKQPCCKTFDISEIYFYALDIHDENSKQEKNHIMESLLQV